MIPPESEGSENHGVYWDYIGTFTDNNITARHPATKAFHVNDVATTTSMNWAVFLWSAISGTSVGSQLVRLGTQPGFSTRASMVALDPTTKGGRVVQLPASGGTLTANMSAILPDAVNWLCPRPKARVVFDLSHQPRLGVDAWDTLAAFKPRYSNLRNELVSRGYTFDKLYPSALGNFTAARLASYDMLMLVLPDYNLTAADRSAVTAWINAGGSLLAIGEGPWGYLAGDQQINLLLTGFGVSIDVDTTHYNMTTGTIATKDMHPTTEACSGLSMGFRGYINTTGSGRRIWYQGANVLFGADQHGAGRVILCADMNWLENANLGSADNEQYAINVVNWLTAATATVLLYTDEPFSANEYRTPVCLALNDLGVSYALTFDGAYFNLSLNLYAWTLVVVDNPWHSITSYYGEIGQYVDAGGRLLFSSYTVDNVASSPLWPKLGFTFAADMPGSVPVYIWSASHDIFTTPNAYHAGNFTPTIDYGDEGDLLTVQSNATALAGATATATAGQAVIILRNDKHTLYNGYLIDQFAGDLDDSTYADRLELWENEIAFMLVPLPPPPFELPWWLLPLVLVIIIVVIVIIVVVLLLRRRKAAAK
jgi:hypothetical protein